ncbi:MAG: cytochrome c-type biogenesis protein CcmH [Pyrinomonadaceae bacterium]|nr:cytochrome c-type biogenesis protein CcmH [Pyrinomonadaceae bacterium]
MKLIVVFLAILFSVPVIALAKEARPVSDDPELEKRVMALSEELRCLVCQNETLAGSNAELAVNLRNQIREQMTAGKSDREIIAFMTERYGKFILFRPPVDRTTYLLWFGPFILLLAALIFLFRYVRRRRELIVDTPLTAAERRRAEDLLQTESGKTAA